METGNIEKQRLISKNVLVWARDVSIALVVAIVIMLFIKPTIVREHSMLNTLDEKDYIFLSKQAYTLGKVDHGDIVVFHSDLKDEKGVRKNLIKRVIGLSGDKVAIHDGSVYLNGAKLDEPYTKDGRTDGEMPEVVVPEDELFLMGDNRQASTDSRNPDVGFVSEDRLVGKAIFRLFPLKNIGPLK